MARALSDDLCSRVLAATGNGFHTVGSSTAWNLDFNGPLPGWRAYDKGGSGLPKSS